MVSHHVVDRPLTRRRVARHVVGVKVHSADRVVLVTDDLYLEGSPLTSHRLRIHDNQLTSVEFPAFIPASEVVDDVNAHCTPAGYKPFSRGQTTALLTVYRDVVLDHIGP